MLLCPNGKWCCDKNRQVGNCCDWDNPTYVNLAAKPSVLTSITSLPPVTPLSSTVQHSQTASSGTHGMN